MERIDEIPQEEPQQAQSETSVDLSNSRRKNWKEKLVTLALVGGLFGGAYGCKASDEKKNIEPVPNNTFEEVLEGNLETNISTDRIIVEKQKIGKRPNTQFNFPEVMIESNTETERYAAFKFNNIDHSVEAQNFIKIMNPQCNDIMTYSVDKDTLFMEFENPREIPNIKIDLENIEETLETIHSTFFSNNLPFQIDTIVKEDGYYRVEYRHLLDDLPIYIYHSRPYLLITPEGKLKGGRFLLAEFEKLGEVSILSEKQLSEDINAPDYQKSTLFNLVDLSVHDKFGFYGYQQTGDEKAKVDVESMNLEYYYHGRYQEAVVPVYMLEGSGVVEIDGEETKATFYVWANALSSEHTK